MLYRVSKGLPDGVAVPKLTDLQPDATQETKEAVLKLRQLILEPEALEARKREVGIVASMIE